MGAPRDVMRYFRRFRQMYHRDYRHSMSCCTICNHVSRFIIKLGTATATFVRVSITLQANINDELIGLKLHDDGVMK